MFELLKKWDQELLIFLNLLGSERYDSFWLFITRIDSWIPLFILLGFLIFYYHKAKKAAIIIGFVLFTFGITLLLTDVVKEIVERLRPNNVPALSEIIRILQKPVTYGFFSGHASSSFAISTFVLFALRNHTKWIYLVFLWPLLFVLSRIYVGVHYPSDIAVGAFVGTTLAIGSYWLYKKTAARLAI